MRPPALHRAPRMVVIVNQALAKLGMAAATLPTVASLACDVGVGSRAPLSDTSQTLSLGAARLVSMGTSIKGGVTSLRRTSIQSQ